MAKLINADPLELLSLILVDILLTIAARKDDFRSRRKAPLGPRPIHVLRAGRYFRIDRLGTVQEFAELREGLRSNSAR